MGLRHVWEKWSTQEGYEADTTSSRTFNWVGQWDLNSDKRPNPCTTMVYSNSESSKSIPSQDKLLSILNNTTSWSRAKQTIGRSPTKTDYSYSIARNWILFLCNDIEYDTGHRDDATPPSSDPTYQGNAWYFDSSDTNPMRLGVGGTKPPRAVFCGNSSPKGISVKWGGFASNVSYADVTIPADWPMAKLGNIKGSTSYGNVSANSESAYPANSYSGSYWYIYKGSDSIDPTAITYSPNPAKGGELVTITITPSTSITYGGTISYKYEYQLDSGSWQVLNNSTSETSVSVVIPKGTTKFTARVTASDNMGFISTPIVGDTITVNNNSNPVINFNNPTTDFGDVINNSQLSAVFYITDPDGDTLTLDSVKIKIDDKELTDFGQRYVSDGIYYCDLKVNESDFLQLPIGSHQLIIEANDGNGGKAIHTVSFNKVLYTTTLTLSEPMEADAIITKCTVSIVYNISTDADFEFLVTNNGFDENPTWEDMTNYVKNSWNYQFTNQTFTSNKYGFNFKLTVSRGESNIGGYIQSISGGFE